MMSLGVGGEELSMATLEAGTTPKAATNRHRDTYLREYLPEKMQS